MTKASGKQPEAFVKCVKNPLFRESFADGDEILGFQCRAADQAAVHVCLGEQFGCIAGFAAAAVKDYGFVRSIAEFLSQHLADKGVDLLCLFGRSGLAGTDGPYGLDLSRHATTSRRHRSTLPSHSR